ncbi:hypothetical protein EDC04DRAFT_2844437 [Pisolithus marmoratus]|nr:hypothetical protein EDC04DRAFT_2844437 [Pisolithus marmoratus]
MDQLVSFEAILFPSDGRNPHMVPLTTSPTAVQDPLAPYSGLPVRMPHPEVYMDYIAEGLGSRAWSYHVSNLRTVFRGAHIGGMPDQLVEALDCMNKKFTHPYVIFYPIVSRDGMPFPVNKFIREIQIQGKSFREATAWRGNIIVAKYRESPFTSMVNGSIADFPILRNYFLTHGAPCEQIPLHVNQGHVNVIHSASH